MAPDTCRPFSRDRRGMVLGEGAGIVVLEPVEEARARGAEVYAEVAGAGMSADAGHLIQPSEAGAAQAMEMALDDAKLSPREVHYINAHGTGTQTNDVTEDEGPSAASFGAHRRPAGRLLHQVDARPTLWELRERWSWWPPYLLYGTGSPLPRPTSRTRTRNAIWDYVPNISRENAD